MTTLFGNRSRKCVISLCLIISLGSMMGQGSGSTASAVKTSKEADILFQEESMIKAVLKGDFKEILKDRGDERSYHAAVFQYQDAENNSVSLDMKVRVRGISGDREAIVISPLCGSILLQGIPGEPFSKDRTN